MHKEIADFLFDGIFFSFIIQTTSNETVPVQDNRLTAAAAEPAASSDNNETMQEISDVDATELNNAIHETSHHDEVVLKQGGASEVVEVMASAESVDNVIHDISSSTASSGAVTLETLSEDSVLASMVTHPGMTSGLHGMTSGLHGMTSGLHGMTSGLHGVTSSANGGHQSHSIHHHPLLTPTSPRSVTTASMSASGKLIFYTIYFSIIFKSTY